jgi:hypothetical protein
LLPELCRRHLLVTMDQPEQLAQRLAQPLAVDAIRLASFAQKCPPAH